MDKNRTVKVLLFAILVSIGSYKQSCHAAFLNDWEYTIVNNKVELQRYYGTNADVSIPSQMEGKPVNRTVGGLFIDCPNLTTVHIPASLTEIVLFNPQNCPKLVEFSIDYANPTYCCHNGVLFTKNMQQIVKYPCGREGSYQIPNTVERIWEYLFLHCTKVTAVHIPGSVKDLGYSVFEDCTNLTTITVDPSNPLFCSQDGVLFTKDMKALCQYPSAKVGAYVVPSGVTRLEPGAFVDANSLTSLYLPYSINAIEMTPFSDCTGLEKITVDSASTVLQSVDGVFFDKGCHRLLRYPPQKTGDYAIPSSVYEVRCMAFKNNPYLHSITIPQSVTNIEVGAFKACDNLRHISVDSRNEFYSSLDDVLFNKSHTDLLVFPAKKTGEYTVPSTVTHIDQAFYHCQGPLTVQLPDSVHELWPWTFSQCYGLQSITLPNKLTRIYGLAFENCTNLHQITFPASLKTIDAYAFRNTGLTDVTLPPQLGSIEAGLFAGCNLLTNVVVNAGVTNIGDKAFSSCTNLLSVRFEGDRVMRTGNDIFLFSPNATVFFKPNKLGWWYNSFFAGKPTQLWIPSDEFSSWAATIGLQTGFPNACSEDADADGDGVSNYSEMLAGTNPTNKESFFGMIPKPADSELTRVDTLPIGPDDIAFYFNCVSNKVYVVETKEEFSDEWQFGWKMIALANKKRLVITATEPQEFFRLRVLP